LSTSHGSVKAYRDRKDRASWLTQKQVRVLFRPLLDNELLDLPVEQLLASLRFEQSGKLDQLGIEMGTFE
jgi:hypothetical protein